MMEIVYLFCATVMQAPPGANYTIPTHIKCESPITWSQDQKELFLVRRKDGTIAVFQVRCEPDIFAAKLNECKPRDRR